MRWCSRFRGDRCAVFLACGAHFSLVATRILWFSLSSMVPHVPIQCAVCCRLVITGTICCVLLAFKAIDPHVLCWLAVCGPLALSLQGRGLLARIQTILLRILFAFIGIHWHMNPNSENQNWVRLCPFSCLLLSFIAFFAILASLLQCCVCAVEVRLLNLAVHGS
jgi:hypothetical protein